MNKKFIPLLLFIILSIGCASIQVTVKNYPVLITGKWQAVSFGNTVVQLGLSLPSEYEFQENGSYISMQTIEGKPRRFSGTYKINTLENPVVILVERTDGRIFHGIIRFDNKNRFTLVLYDKRILPLTGEFHTDDIQVYKRKE